LVFEYFTKNLSWKFKFYLNLAVITGALHEDRYICTFMITSRSVLPRMSNVSHKICRENQNTQFTSMNNKSPPPKKKSCRLWDIEMDFVICGFCNM
jgi:hypothetical protein